MTTDEILKLAKECGFFDYYEVNTNIKRDMKYLEAFAQAVRSAALEEAITLCRNRASDMSIHPLAAKGAFYCADAIRALKQGEK